MDIFNENFALELQMHPEYKEQYKINNGLVTLSEQLGAPLTVSSDAHFLTEDDRDLRKVVQAIAWKKQYKDVGDSLKSNCLGNSEIIKNNASQMGFDLTIAEKAIDFTNVIASKCNANLCSEDRKIPVFDKHEEFDVLFEEMM